MNHEDSSLGVQVFAQSLAYLRHCFPDAPITVVYIPAPLSIYRNVSPMVTYVIHPADENASDSAPVERVTQRSDQVCDLVRDAATAGGAGFLDARPMLRAAAAARLLPRRASRFARRRQAKARGSGAASSRPAASLDELEQPPPPELAG